MPGFSFTGTGYWHNCGVNYERAPGGPIVKKIILLISVLLITGIAVAQDSQEDTSPKILLSPNLWSPIFGMYTGTFEIALTETMSVELEPFYWDYSNVNGVDAILSTFFSVNELYIVNLQAGPNFYYGETLDGFFVGGYGRVGYGRLNITGAPLLEGSFLGFGLRTGIKFVWDWLYLGVSVAGEYNHLLVEVNNQTILETAQFTGLNSFRPNGVIQLGIALY
jgi:hypothetical protein